MLSLKNVFFFQAGIGILANAFLLVFHIITRHNFHRPRPTDITICQLAFAHLVMLLIALNISFPDMFTSLDFPIELKCKIFFYLSRVMRGLSMSTTCLLSIIQVITISPNSYLLSFKPKLTKHVAIAFSCIWSLNLCSKSILVIYTVAHSNMTSLFNVSKYCSLSSMNSIIKKLFFMLGLSQSAFFVGLMLISSMYMVVFLCSHQRKSEYLHSMSISPRSSPAKRATCTVLVLVSFFVIMYCVDTTISSFSTALWKYEPAVLDIQSLMGNVYASVSPLVFICSDKRLIDILKKKT